MRRTGRLARFAAVLAALATGHGRSRAGDPPVAGPAPAVPAAPNRPTATPPRPEQAVEEVLAALGAADEAALHVLAARADPDPWIVADLLLARGKRGEAIRFARAAPRYDVEALPGYLAAASGKADDARRRDRLAAAEAHQLAKRPKDAIDALADAPDEPIADVVGIRTGILRGTALAALLRVDDGLRALEAAAKAAEALGWWYGAVVAWNEAGKMSLRAAKYATARESFERTVAINERRNDPISVAKSLINVGVARSSVGELEAALAMYERSLATFDALHEDAASALVCNNVADLLLKMGDVARAREFAERALALRQASGDRAGAARSLSVLGSILRASGEFDRARDVIERAIQTHRRLGDRYAESSALSNLATVFDARGDHAKALSMFERTLTLQEALGLTREVATTLGNIGLVCAGIGDFRRAVASYERAIAAMEAIGDRENVASTSVNLGLARYEDGDTAEALAAFARAVEIAEKIGARGVAARALGNIGLVHDLGGDHAAALAAHERAYAVKESLGDRVGAARSLANVGLVRSELGGSAAGIATLERALEIQETLGDAAGAARTLGNIASILLGAGRTSEALPFARRAARAVGSLARGLGAEEGAGAREPMTFVFDVGAAAAATLDDVREFAFFVEAGRAGGLIDGLRSREALWSIAVSEELRSDESKARFVEAVAVKALQAAVAGGELAVVRARRAELEAARARTSTVIARIQREARSGSAIVQPEPATLDEIRSALSPDEAMVLYALLEPSASALVVTRGDARIVGLGPTAAITAAVQDVELDSPATAPGAALDALARLVVAPLRLPSSATRVLVSPSGALTYVPFAALVPDRTIACTPSGTTHRILLADRDLRGTGVLALGDPEYPPPSSSSDRGRLSALPATRDEAKAIGTVTLLGREATEAGLASAVARSPRWRAVHFACHGLVDTERAERSSLALTPAGDDDGLLTALEVFRMKLPADLITLSACETGRGRVVKSEGIVGLTRAFMFAGAPRVVCSLWKVDDVATQALMTRFHELWNPKDGAPGLPAADALRKAQEHVRSQAKWRHPYYWAAWVLWGLPS